MDSTREIPKKKKVTISINEIQEFPQLKEGGILQIERAQSKKKTKNRE